MRRSSKRLADFFANILDDRPGSSRRQNGEKKARVRRLFGFKRRREEPPRNSVPRWRAPISGHSTFRFESLDAHPFSGPSISDEPFVGGVAVGFGQRRGRRKMVSSSAPSSSVIGSRRSESDDLVGLGSTHLPRRGMASSSSRNHPAATGQGHSSESDNSVIVSPSVRALAALRGLPLPVSPDQVKAETWRQSSSIPRSRVRSPVTLNGVDSQRRAVSYPTSTMRTVDLIEAFPDPPSSPRTPRFRHSAPTRMSLFPAVALLHERSGNVQSVSPSKMRLDVLESVVESAKKRKWASVAASSGPLQVAVPRAGAAASPSASNVWVSGALPGSPEPEGPANVAACSSHPMRGEDANRDRPSGIPVHDRNTTPLRSVKETENPNTTSPTSNHPTTPLSGKTSKTRYFSASSQIPPINQTLPHTEPSSSTMPDLPQRRRNPSEQHQLQRERAVANGALKFSSLFPSEASSSSRAASGPLSGGGVVVVVPLRTTSLDKTCSHGVGGFRARRKSVEWDGFDGALEFRGGSARVSGGELRCLRCEVKRVVRRMARLVR